eukprot:SAG22_NODE_7748_length_711_cov_2.101307_1_plen_149_part_00
MNRRDLLNREIEHKPCSSRKSRRILIITGFSTGRSVCVISVHSGFPVLRLIVCKTVDGNFSLAGVLSSCSFRPALSSSGLIRSDADVSCPDCGEVSCCGVSCPACGEADCIKIVRVLLHPLVQIVLTVLLLAYQCLQFVLSSPSFIAS